MSFLYHSLSISSNHRLGALREVVKDCKVGKLLIQTNEKTHDPELYYCRLPKDIAECKVFLMDATVATGGISIIPLIKFFDFTKL